jgi:hypothetical protein
MGFLFCYDVWGETSVQVARNRLTCTLLVQLDADTEQREVRRGSESLTLYQRNPPMAEEIHLRWMKSLRDEIPLRGVRERISFIRSRKASISSEAVRRRFHPSLARISPCVARFHSATKIISHAESLSTVSGPSRTPVPTRLYLPRTFEYHDVPSFLPPFPPQNPLLSTIRYLTAPLFSAIITRVI